MSIASDLTLIATDPLSGKFRLSVRNLDAVFGGAHLMDLLESGRLAAQGEGRLLKVAVVDRTATGQPDVDFALSRLKDDKPRAVSSMLGKLGRGGRKHAYSALVSANLARPRTKRILGLHVTRYEVLAAGRRDALLRSLRSVLVHGVAPDRTTGPLISLLSASDHIKLVVDKPELKAAKARAQEVTAEDWASEAVQQSLKDATMAVIAAIVVVTSTAASGAS